MSTAILPNDEAQNQVLQAALECQERGWSIIPLHAVRNGRCTCGRADCDKPGKHSPIKWKKYQTQQATADEIKTWWQKWPWTNVGIVTGAISGLLVLDIDGPEGADAVAGRDLPSTVIAETGGGGWHYYFRYPEGGNITNRIALLPHVNIRADGGYVVAPESIHRSGQKYSWLPGADPWLIELAHPPAWLLDMLKPQEFAWIGQQAGATPKADLLPCAMTFLERGTVQGSRDMCLFTLAKHCRRASMGQTDALMMLERANAVCSPSLPVSELQVKIRSAYGEQFGQGYTSLGCDIEFWQTFCPGRDNCPVFNPLKQPWPEPEPIKSELQPVEELPLTIIPGPFRPWLHDISYRVQCPLDFVAAAAIVEAGAVIGASCGIRPKKNDDWLIVPNLWGGIVARPSMLKTPSMAEVLKPLARLELEAKEKYELQMNFYSADLEVFKATKEALKSEMVTAAKGKSKPGNPIPDINDIKNRYLALEEPEAPIQRRYKTNDSTIEKMAELLNENPRGILLFRDELVGLLVSWDREGREADRTFYLEAWNGYGSYTTDRIGRGTIDTQSLCISVLGGIQPAKLIGYLHQASDNLKNDGLVQRLQLLIYPDEPANWKLIDEYPNTEAKNRAYTIFKKLSEINFLNYSAELPEGEKIPFFHFSPEAQVIFNEWLTDLQAGLQAEETPLMVEHLSKYRSLMPSLALIFHLIDIADGQTTGPVSPEAARLGAAWCEYLESHARRIYGLVGNVSTRAAAELAKKLKKGALQDGFTIRDIYRNCWHLLDKKELAQDACSELVEAGWLREQIPENGKTKVTYLINPKIFTLK